ncbi:hypothetical protein Cgig2_012686 [Carnegiea gigantea]|uniref:Reverse transcriptase n=1 Tax=Carnegiea gigantea TaxID=171969 RepID=A0A9Q1Q9J4_9CARY|nr:hypothetical protein Cgig2_012686 [Carnegiea gigantea]
MEWRLKFLERGVKHLVRNQSDHAPIIVSTTVFSPNSTNDSKPFRFQAAWLLHNDFGNFIWQHWNPDAPLIDSIRGLADKLEFVTKETFKYVIDRVDKRHSGWKTKCLSLTGRMTLIKSPILAIPAYAMQTEPHLVSWATVTKPMSEGRLGIRSMLELNSTSMAKLGWRLLHEPTALWTRVLYHKYCKGRKGTSNSWKGIIESSPILQKGIQHSIGDGRGTNFWL